MHAMIALALLSSAVGNPDTGSVRGTVKATNDGMLLNCVAVFLIPRSPTTDQMVAEKFGEIDHGREAIALRALPLVKSSPPQGSRKSRCNGRFTESFEFSNVQPGEYYLTTTAMPRGADIGDGSKFPKKAVQMMQRVSVAPGSSVEAHLLSTS